MNVVAIIADIIDSRNIPDRAAFQRNLKMQLAKITSQSREQLLSPYTLTLGDEFQAVYKGFTTLFCDLTAVLTAIYPQRIRVAISYGPLSTDINPQAALEMDGPAFNEARRLLEQLKKTQTTVIQVTTTELFNTHLVNICLRLLSNELNRWQESTLKIFDGLLRNQTSKQIADVLNITARGVNKNIATNNVHDYVELSHILSDELKRNFSLE